MRTWLAALLFGLPLLAAAGCGQGNLWWEYRDDPYLANLAARGDAEVMRSVNAQKKDEREMALRILATRAGEARRRGDADRAARLEETVIRRYAVEKEQEVRACIVRICAPAVGRGGSAMVRFLRQRIAMGEFPGYAAISLASLGPRNALDDIEPLTRHPAPEVRYQAATALVLLGDPGGVDAVDRVLRSMRSSAWPDPLDDIPLQQARESLESRAIRAFGPDRAGAGQ